MDAQAWSRVNGVLDRLESVEGAEREALLQRVCRGDAALERLVREQLAAMAQVSEGFLGAGTQPSGSPELHGYRILRQVGRGGGGVVYEAEQESADRRVALKVLHHDDDLAGDLARRLRREARVLAQLAAKGIATLFDVGGDSRSTWVAMEWIDGHDVAREIALHSTGELESDSRPILPGFDEPEQLVRRIELIAQVAGTLHEAHERGVIHRDVKASNIMLTRSGEPKLVDFGLARMMTNETITESGVIAGSVHTMSPEQARGAALDRRTDVYSLGVVLFHLVSGRLPYSGRDALAVLRALEQGRTPRLGQVAPNIPADLDAVCAKAMAYEADDRYPTAAEFAEDLKRLADGRPVAARPLGWTARLWRWMKRKRRGLTVAVAAAVVLGVLVLQARVAGQRAELLAALDTLEGQVDTHIAASDTPSLQAAAARLSALEGRIDRGSSLAARATLLRSKLRSFGALRAEATRAALESALAPPWNSTQDLRSVFSLRAALNDAEALADLGESAPRAQDSSADFPRLSLATDGALDTVDVQVLDPVTGLVRGETTTLTLPVAEHLLAPGNYRLTIRRPGFGTLELTRWYGEWGRHFDEGTRRLRASALLEADMVHIPAGTTKIVLPISKGGTFQQVTVEVPAFFIDPYEVTNGEYAEFLASVPTPTPFEPPYWSLVTTTAGWRDLPVAGVTYYQARAFAEWAGKRLPTEPEWNRALEGAEERPFPWGTDPAPLASLFRPNEAADDPDLEPAERVRAWMSALHPARTRTTDSTLDTPPILHLAGNVAEWTETMALGEVEGRLHELPTHRRGKGWSWRGRTSSFLKQYHEVQATFVESTPTRGIRCARSAP